MSELPNGWCEVTIADVTSPFVITDPTKTPTALFKYVDIGSIDNKTQTITNPKVIKGAEAPSRARRVIQAGDTLFSTVRTYLKNIALVPEDLDGQLTSTGIAVLRPKEVVNPRYLFAWACSDKFVGEITVTQDGTMYPAVSDRDVTDGMIRVPPLPEQGRIVAKIDSLSGKSRRACDQLDHIPRLVEKYKQAILAAAFRGELTREWRQAHPTGSAWHDVTLQDIAEIQSGIALGKKRTTDTRLIERPYLRVANVQRGWLDLNEIKQIKVTEPEASRLYLRHGDILMNEGGDRDKLGRGWFWEGQIDNCIHQNHVFRVRLRDPAFPPKLISLYANEIGQSHFFDEGTQTTNLASISKTRLSSLPLRLPPVKEAHVILARVEAAFSWIDRLASETTSARRLVDHLDQAILAKAFRGELVPQDPNDEPAGVLLERIKQTSSPQAGPSPRQTSRGEGFLRGS